MTCTARTTVRVATSGVGRNALSCDEETTCTVIAYAPTSPIIFMSRDVVTLSMKAVLVPDSTELTLQEMAAWLSASCLAIWPKPAQRGMVLPVSEQWGGSGESILRQRGEDAA